MNTYPHDADHITTVPYIKRTKKQGKYVDVQVEDKEIHTCPSCGRSEKSLFRHGVTVVCTCGLHCLVFGIGLYVWRKTASPETVPQKWLRKKWKTSWLHRGEEELLLKTLVRIEKNHKIDTSGELL